MEKDIVYILKNDVNSEELRYSLRSICKNFRFNNVWFFGGKPEGIEPDHYVFFSQSGKNKWEKATSVYECIFTTKEITNEFYLFNDDFFVLNSYKQNNHYVIGTLKNRIDRILARKKSAYANMLIETKEMLEAYGYDTLDYGSHTPFLINKQKGFDTIKTFGIGKSFRSLYGNYNRIGGIIKPDVKIANLYDIPSNTQTLVSTNDKSFYHGRVGDFIRNYFPNPCKYEQLVYEDKYYNIEVSNS